jgi:hypothetical protein
MVSHGLGGGFRLARRVKALEEHLRSKIIFATHPRHVPELTRECDAAPHGDEADCDAQDHVEQVVYETPLLDQPNRLVLKVEKVVYAPTKPTATASRGCRLTLTRSAANSRKKPMRKEPVILMTKVAVGKGAAVRDSTDPPT